MLFDSLAVTSMSDSVQAIVHDLINEWRQRHTNEIRWYKIPRDWDENLRIAAHSIVINKRGRRVRHTYQCRIPFAVLERARAALAQVDLQSAGDFDMLFLAVRETIGGIPGIGELAVYDIAHRLGEYLGIPPIKVYLHSGARVVREHWVSLGNPRL
jgi:hypothetical protein